MNDYIVIRPAPGLPPGFLPEDWDGRWLDVSLAPYFLHPSFSGGLEATATGRFESRNDGAQAEILEVRP